jgi:hypothetical protein
MANIEGLGGKSNSCSEKAIHVQLAVASIIEEVLLLYWVIDNVIPQRKYDSATSYVSLTKGHSRIHKDEVWV